jgi:hypothetical protein
MYSHAPTSGDVRGGRTSSHHRGGRSARSGQTIVYPACATKQEALDLVLFVHDNATRILATGGDAFSPVIHVSCAATLRDIMAGSGATCGIFATDTKAKTLSRAKAFLPGFCITLRRDRSFTTVSGAHQVEQAGAYQAQFHWHEGEGRLTLDPVSKRTADSSSRPSISHPFAYHGLPFLLEPVFRAWQSEHQRPSTSGSQALAGPSLPLQDFHPVIQAQFLGVQFSETGGWSPAWKGDQLATPPPMRQAAAVTPIVQHQVPRMAFTTPPRGPGRGPNLSVTPPGDGTVVGLYGNATPGTPPLGPTAPSFPYTHERTRQEGSVALVPRAAQKGSLGPGLFTCS